MSDKASIFRKTSLERIASPEQLNDYIKVSRPSVWLIMASIIVLLIGICIWGVFGRLTTLQDALAIVSDGVATCYLYAQDANAIKAGMPIKIGDSNGIVTNADATPIEITKDFDDYALFIGDLKIGDWVSPIVAEIDIADGAYIAQIVSESISPVFFVLN